MGTNTRGSDQGSYCRELFGEERPHGFAASVLLVGWLAGACALPWGPTARANAPRGATNLAIAVEISPRQFAHSALGVRVVNLAEDASIGMVHLRLLNSTGETQARLTPADGLPISIPAASEGGLDGVWISVLAPASTDSLFEELSRNSADGAILATVETNGADSNLSDNAAVLEFGAWARLAPGNSLTHEFVVWVPPRVRTARAKIEHVRLPAGIELSGGGSGGSRRLRPGRNWIAVSARATSALVHGATWVARIQVVDEKSAQVLVVREWTATFDTLPPVARNYRAVAFADGRVAVAVHVADRNSTVLGGGVQSVYSSDGGMTWRRVAHSPVPDAIGTGARWTSVLGPFNSRDLVLLGVTLIDAAGNANTELPRDAVVLSAPPGAERLLETFPHNRLGGHPAIFPELVVRAARWLDSDELSLNAEALGLSTAEQSRRARDLATIARSLERVGAAASDYATLSVHRDYEVAPAFPVRALLRIVIP